MSEKAGQEKLDMWMVEYRYGELTPEEKACFEQALATDKAFKQRYEAFTAFDELVPKGTQPILGDERLQSLRWSTLRALRRQQRPSFLQRLLTLWRIQLPLGVQVVGMAALFVVGVFLGGKWVPASGGEAGQDIFALINDEDYRIVDLNLEAVDASKGDVRFSFGLSALSSVEGNLDNPQIRHVLTQALQTDSQDDVRMQLTSLFGPYARHKGVRSALIHAVLNDPNPGVRYNAVEQLVKMPAHEDTRHALLSVLAHDVNPGIRVEAFLALVDRIDQHFLDVLSQHSINDANTFIRERAKKLLSEYTVTDAVDNAAVSI